MTTTVSILRALSRPNWAEISLSSLVNNYRRLRQQVGSTVIVCPVVKCDAYGHGAAECAAALQAEGAGWFAVTCVDEGVALRDAGITARILMLSGFCAGEEDDVLRFGLTPAVSRLEELQRLVRAAHGRKLRRPVAVHLKLDTGMGRLGLPLAQLKAFAEGTRALENVEVEGVFSHMASSEVLDAEDARQQTLRFRQAVETLKTHGLKPALRHLANSAAIAARPDTWHNFVRPGLALYGIPMPLRGGPSTSL